MGFLLKVFVVLRLAKGFLLYNLPKVFGSLLAIGCFPHFFWKAQSYSAMRAMSIESACGLVAQLPCKL